MTPHDTPQHKTHLALYRGFIRTCRLNPIEPTSDSELISTIDQYARPRIAVFTVLSEDGPDATDHRGVSALVIAVARRDTPPYVNTTQFSARHTLTHIGVSR